MADQMKMKTLQTVGLLFLPPNFTPDRLIRSRFKSNINKT